MAVAGGGALAVAGGGALAGQQASYRAPRMADGTPDLQGIWQVLSTAEDDIQTHQARLGVPAGLGVVEGEEIPYQPWALAQKQENFEAGEAADPAAQCFFPGVPRIMYMPYPFRIVQTPDFVELFFEFGHHTGSSTRTACRTTNKFLSGWATPAAAGRARRSSSSRRISMTRTGFDKAGNFHSEALELVERFTRTGPNHIWYEVTVTEPHGLHPALDDGHDTLPSSRAQRAAPRIRVFCSQRL